MLGIAVWKMLFQKGVGQMELGGKFCLPAALWKKVRTMSQICRNGICAAFILAGRYSFFNHTIDRATGSSHLLFKYLAFGQGIDTFIKGETMQPLKHRYACL